MTAFYLSIAIILLALIAYYIFYISPKLDPANKAEEFIRQNKLQDAIIEYKKILEEDPLKFVIHYKLSEIYLKLGDNDKAAFHLEKILNINKYNYEVEKVNIQKKLAHIYFFRSDLKNTFELYLDILHQFPADSEALYHVSFMALGQEEFDISQKYFEKLVKVKKDDFDSLFGAGISSYQNQKTNDAILYFKNALNIKPHSDIGNLAIIFALYRKRDFRQAMAYVSKIINISNDPSVLFIIKRLEAFLLINLRKFQDAVKKFEDLLVVTKKNDLFDELTMTLYDLGFASYKAEYTSRGYEYWNDLEELQHGYKNVSKLIMILRKEMDRSRSERHEFEDSISDYIDDWLMNAFEKDFLWRICGLRNNEKFDVRNSMVKTKTSLEAPDIEVASTGEKKSISTGNLIEDFTKLDTESFRIISNRVVEKLGYKVQQILATYRESDGVDFMALDKETKEIVFVSVRRWKQKVGEIPLRNFAQAINDMKANKGLFIVTADITPGAESMMDRLSKVELIRSDELGIILKGLL